VPLDHQSFRAAFANVATSVAVVTTRDGHGVPHGMTVGSLCALSVTPPLLSFSVERGRRCHEPLSKAERVRVSVLAQGQEHVAQRFSQPYGARFADDVIEIDGLPTVRGALCWLTCSPERVVTAGDHSIIIARVDDARVGKRQPLIYWQRGYRAIHTGGRIQAAQSWVTPAERPVASVALARSATAS
jgi:flavin reductase ActVB